MAVLILLVDEAKFDLKDREGRVRYNYPNVTQFCTSFRIRILGDIRRSKPFLSIVNLDL